MRREPRAALDSDRRAHEQALAGLRQELEAARRALAESEAQAFPGGNGDHGSAEAAIELASAHRMIDDLSIQVQEARQANHRLRAYLTSMGITINTDGL